MNKEVKYIKLLSLRDQWELNLGSFTIYNKNCYGVHVLNRTFFIVRSDPKQDPDPLFHEADLSIRINIKINGSKTQF